MSFGARVRYHRERAGMTRAVLGGLVGRSEEWVKAVENDRLLIPRLPMLLRLADVLGITDFGQLTGGQCIPVASINKGEHAAAGVVATAMTNCVRVPAAEQPSVAALTARVDQAWAWWHRSNAHRSVLATVLPDLLTTAHATTRALTGKHRRVALAEQARVYHLAQLFFSFQPAKQLVWLAADRAMTAATDADDPAAIAVAARYYAHVYRSSGQLGAAEDVLVNAATLLDPNADGEQLARWGQLQLFLALTHAKAGRAGQAWRYLDLAGEAADRYGGPHPWLLFGRPAIDAYAVTIETDLFRLGEATRRVERYDPTALPSRTRRAVYLIDAARAYSLRKDNIAVVHLLGNALREAVETVRYNTFACATVLDLAEHGGAVRADARKLAAAIDLPSYGGRRPHS
ncbi:MAG: helix-turn-helix domain-containing protein [Pseudonocardiaceae bacterium]